MFANEVNMLPGMDEKRSIAFAISGSTIMIILIKCYQQCDIVKDHPVGNEPDG